MEDIDKKLEKFGEDINKVNLSKSIKSNLIMKTIFSFVKPKKKLQLIKHSKTLQKKIFMSIEDYKKYTGLNIKKGRKDNIKIFSYNTNILLFNGKYLNGKKNGKVKEYNKKGELIFEGEYLNGKKNGKGKEYYGHNHLIFEGEYLNDKIWNGKGYNYYSKIIMKKYLIFKKRKMKTRTHNLKCNFKIINGKGRIEMYYNPINPKRRQNIKKIIIFEGEYLNGELNGLVREYHNHGDLIFEGEYKNDKKNGKGKEYHHYNNKLRFEGEYLNGKKNGNGKEYDYNGNLIFEGEYKNGFKWNGKGYNNNRKIKRI